MVVWLCQIRQPGKMADDLVPMGVDRLPTFAQFVERLKRQKLYSIIGDERAFEQEYFNPMMFAIKKLGLSPTGYEEWPHCSWNQDGNIWTFQGFGPKMIEL